MSDVTPQKPKKSEDKVDGVSSGQVDSMNSNHTAAKALNKKRKRKGPNDKTKSPSPTEEDQPISTPTTPAPMNKKRKMNKNGSTPKKEHNENGSLHTPKGLSRNASVGQDDVGVLLLTCTEISTIHYLRIVKQGQSWKQTLDFIRRKWPQLSKLKDDQIQFTCQFSNRTMSIDEEDDFDEIVSLAITKGNQPEDPLTLDVKPNMDSKPNGVVARKSASKPVQSMSNTPANGKRATSTNTPTTWNITVQVPTTEEESRKEEPKVEIETPKPITKKAAKRKASPNDHDMSFDTDAEDAEVQYELGLAEDSTIDHKKKIQDSPRKDENRPKVTEAMEGNPIPLPAKSASKGGRKTTRKQGAKAPAPSADEKLTMDSPMEVIQPQEFEIAKVIEGGIEKVKEAYEKLTEKADLTSNEKDARDKFGEWIESFQSKEAGKAEEEKKKKEAEQKKALEIDEENKRKTKEAEEQKKRSEEEAEQPEEEKKRKIEEAEKKKKALAEEKLRKKDELAKQRAEEKFKKEAEAAAKKEEAAAKRKAAAEEKERKKAAAEAKKEADRQLLETFKKKAQEEEERRILEEEKKKKEEKMQDGPGHDDKANEKEAKSEQGRTTNVKTNDNDSNNTSSSSEQDSSDDSDRDSDSDSDDSDDSSDAQESEKKKSSADTAITKASSSPSNDKEKGNENKTAPHSFGYPRFTNLDPSKIKVQNPYTSSKNPTINGKNVTDGNDSSSSSSSEDDESDDDESSSSSSSSSSSEEENDSSKKNAKALEKQKSSIPQTKRAGAKSVNQKFDKAQSSTKKQKNLLSKLTAKS